jgi:hypothetical protein
MTRHDACGMTDHDALRVYMHCDTKWRNRFRSRNALFRRPRRPPGGPEGGRSAQRMARPRLAAALPSGAPSTDYSAVESAPASVAVRT